MRFVPCGHIELRGSTRKLPDSFRMCAAPGESNSVELIAAVGFRSGENTAMAGDSYSERTSDY